MGEFDKESDLWSSQSSPRGDEEACEFTVERIVDRRIVDGRLEYLLKWDGYSEDENSWEPMENLHCFEMIELFERKKLIELMARESKYLTGSEQTMSKFEQGFDVEAVLNVLMVDGELLHLVKFRDSHTVELVPANLVNEKWPCLVIEFYERRIQFSNSY